MAAMAAIRAGAQPPALTVAPTTSPEPAAAPAAGGLNTEPSPAAAGPDSAGSASPSDSQSGQPVQPAAAPATPPTPPTPPTEPTAIPEDHPALVQLRKQEQHIRRQLAEQRDAFRAEMDREQRAHQARIEKAEAIERRISSLRSDPDAVIALLSEAGYGEADFEPLGKLLYGHGPEGAKQPGYKAQAHQTLAQRQLAEKVTALEKQIAEAHQAQQRQAAEAQAMANLDRWYSSVTKAADDTTPLARAALAKNPERARDRMLAIADRIYVQSGPSDDLRDVPTAAQVLRAYEAERAAELEELGIDPKTAFRPAAPPRPAATLAPSAPAAVTPPVVVAPTGPAQVVSAPGTPPVAAKPAPPTREEFLADIARRKAAGEF